MSKPKCLVVVALVLGLAACSGSDDGDEASGESVSSAPETESTAVTTTTAASSADETASSSDTASSADSSSDPSFSGDPDSEWCVASRAIDEFGDSVDDNAIFDPDQAKGYFEQQQALIAAAAEVAPPEIADDVAVLVRANTAMMRALDGVGFDVMSADLSMLSTPAVEQAQTRLDAYDEQVCGIVDDDDSSSDDLAAGEGTIADQFVAQLQTAGFTEDEAQCVMENIDFGDAAALEDAAMIAVFDTCGIDADRLLEIGGS